MEIPGVEILPVGVGEEAEGSLDVLGVGGSAGVPLAQEVECPEHIEDENGGPAGEEEEHDQDQHVDNLNQGELEVGRNWL